MAAINDRQARRIFIGVAIVLLLVVLSNATMRTVGTESAEVIAVHQVPGDRSTGGIHWVVVVRRDDGTTAMLRAGRTPLPQVGTRIRIERRTDLVGRQGLRIAPP